MKIDARLIRLARQAGAALILTVLFGLAGGLLVVLQARQVTSIISGVFLAGKDLPEIAPYFIPLLVIIGLRALTTLAAETSANEAALRVKTNLRVALTQHLIDLGPAALKREKTAELANTAIQGVEALDAYFNQYLPQVALAVMIPLVILIAVFPGDVLSGVVLGVTAPLIPLFMLLIGKATEAVTHRQWTSLSRLSDFFLDSIQGLRELKQLGQSRRRADQIDAAAQQHRAVTMRVLRVTFTSALALELISTISTAVIAVEIGLRLLYGRMGFEQAFFILLLAPEFYLPLRMLGQRFHAALNGVSAARRIFELLDLPVQQAQVRPGLQVDLTVPFTIRFQDVSYTYAEAERAAVDQLNFEISLGEKVALVGPSGAGKSTIAQMLLRFLQPDAGKIFVNQTPLSQFDLAGWRRQVAWVPQQPFLFHESLANNISPIEHNHRKKHVDQVIRQAGLDEVVHGLPLGLDTDIGERGARLSGGEAQRLALARAFYLDVPLLVLDEPTASLDPLLEAQLEQSTRELLHGKTALIIAHRLTTAASADRILVVESGRVVESGSHVELLARRGAYFEMVQAFGGRE